MRRLLRRDPAGDPDRPPRTPILSTALAAAVGLVVLLDLLTDRPLFNVVGARLVDYALIVAAFALILGVLNVLNVHLRKVQARTEGWPYSVVLLVVVVALLVVGLATGPRAPALDWTLNFVLLPLQSTFFSLLAFFLLGVAYRAMRVRSLESLLLVASAVIVVVGATPLGARLGPMVVGAKDVLLTIPATAGARGLLFGIAIGTVVTGLRLIFDGQRYFK